MARLLVLLVLNVLIMNALAEPQADIYRVEIMVADQSEAERVKAAKATFGEVISRVTGDPSALQNPQILAAINSAPNYLMRFNYASDRDEKNVKDVKAVDVVKTGDAAKTSDSSKTSMIKNDVRLILNFSPQAVEKLLRDAQLSQKLSQQKMLIQVTNVQDFTTYKQVQAYLKTVAMIRHSDLVSANKDSLVFSVLVDGDANALKIIFETKTQSPVVDSVPNENSIPSNPPLQWILRWYDQS